MNAARLPVRRRSAVAISRTVSRTCGSGDDVYVDSYLDGSLIPTPIGAVTGYDLGDPALGRMDHWTVSVVTSSKTFALPTSRVAFATTANPVLRMGMNHYRTMLSHGRVPQGDELAAAAALCLTPTAWIDSWNRHYARRVEWLSANLALLNQELGGVAFDLAPPQGGWYAALRIRPELFNDARVRSSVHALAVLLHYAGDRRNSGIALLSGELAGYTVDPTRPEFVLRANLAVTDDELVQFVERLRDCAHHLRSPQASGVVDHALKRAHAAVDLHRIAT